MKDKNEKRYKLSKKTRVIIAVCAAIIFLGGLGFSAGVLVTENKYGSQEFKDLMRIYEILNKAYYENVDIDAFTEGAIRGAVTSLNDPYSVFYNEEETAEYFTQLENEFVGIGVVLKETINGVVIERIIDDSPAKKGGLLEGDIFYKVDDVDVSESTIEEIRTLTLGEKGVVVDISVLRNEKELDFSITRDLVEIDTVITKTFENNGLYGYIQITSFTSTVDKEFKEAYQNLKKQGIEGLVIDVRNNGGGYLQPTLKIADIFVDDSKPIYREEHRSKNSDIVYGDKNRDDLPLAVLVNGNSASASEMLAAALNEAGNAMIVGETTFGKGTIQSSEYIDDNMLKLTTAKWLTPNGEWIHEVGIVPDYDESLAEPLLYQDLYIENSLAYDMVDSRILQMQLILNLKGYSVRSDGYFDKKTQTALKAYQEKNNLKVNGVLDVATAANLTKDLNEYQEDDMNDNQLQLALSLLSGDVDE